MNNITIKKFTNSLDKNIKKMKNDILIAALKRNSKNLTEKEEAVLELISLRKCVKRMINIPKEEWYLHGEIFLNFDKLSFMLDESDLRTREKVEIIFLILEKNLATNLLHCNMKGFDELKLINYPFQHTNYEEVRDLIYSNTYRQLCAKEKYKLTEQEKLILEEIEKAISENSLDLSNEITQHKIIKEHYFDKYPNLDQSDIIAIIGVLKELKITPNLLEEVNEYFSSLIEKKNRKKQKENVKITIQKNNKTQVIPKVSEKEFNALNRKLKPYYDLNNNVAIRSLSLKEQITCLQLLQKMDISEERINGILRKINKLSSKHPIAIYMQLYEKFSYYKENEQIAAALNELEKYYWQIFMCDAEDYAIIKMIFEDVVTNILQQIPKTYDYEYTKAKVLKK